MLTPCNSIPNKKKSATRKKASSFSFAVYDSVSMINEVHWNDVIKDKNEFLQLNYLIALENSRPTNMRFHYALMYRDDQPAAVAYFQVLDFSPNGIVNLVGDDETCFINIKRHITKHIITGANKLNMRLLICGNSFLSGEHGFLFKSTINPIDAFDALADVIYRISRSEKLRGKIAAVLVKDFYSTSVKNAVELEEFKYHDFLVEPNMVLKLQPDWKSFDNYLAALSKKYRKRAKGIIKKGENIERKLLTLEEIKKYSKSINELYLNVLRKAKFRLASLPLGYFFEMKNRMKDDFQVTGYFLNEKLIGFKSTFILKKEIDAHFVGVDYSINYEYELYQNILYDYVKEAIYYNRKSLNLGRTASEIKSNIGAKAFDLTCYIRHRNPLSNQIIKPFVELLKPEEWIPRNPFKEE